MDSLQRWLTLVSLVAAALGALGYLIRKLRRAVRVLDAIDHLVDHELTHNGGTSIKDDITAIAQAVGGLQADLRDLEAEVRSHHPLHVDRHPASPRHKREGERHDP